MKQDDIIEIKIEALGNDSYGIAHCNGYAVFLPYVMEGERVKAKVTYVKKNIAYAKPLEILEPSKLRVTPKCPVFGKCGGCKLQHMDYLAQIDFKRKQFISAMKKNGSLDITPDRVVGSPEVFAYRNKLVLPVSQFKGKPQFGFYMDGSHKIVSLNKCPLHAAWTEKLISAVGKYMLEAGERGYDHEKTHRGDIRHIVARCYEGQLLLTMVTNRKEGLKAPELLYKKVKKALNGNGKELELGLFQSINTKDNSVVFGDEITHLLGIDKITAECGGIRFTLTPSSFFQVNASIFTKLYEDVKAHLSQAEVLIDAYSGIGILTAMLASEKYDTYGVEINPDATRDADRILEINDCPRQKNLNGDAAVILPQLFEENKGKHINLIVDPVRKGLDQSTCDLIARLTPDRFIYVSCNPATQARDLKRILDAQPDYRIEYSAVYDQFPQTSASESIVVLSKNTAFN